MNINLQNSNLMSAGRNSLFGGGCLKSTAQRLERQAVRDRQVAFFENRKENLKNIQCSSPEEVARVLELLHSYEDQIAAVKAEYNNAQMFHLLDEAKEQGEKIAKAIEKSEPKTEEERKKEAVKEALGIEDEGGLLDDIMDQMEEKLAETLEKALEDAPKADAALDQEPTQATEASSAEALAAETSSAEAAAATATETPAVDALAAETSAAEAPTTEALAAKANLGKLYESIPDPSAYKPFNALA